MASTETSIANSALSKIGAERIISLEDGNERARICKEQLPKIRQALIQSHPWNFAIERVSLGEDLVPPEFGFSHRFLLPNECLRVLETDYDESIRWAIEGRYLVSDCASAKIKFLKDITDYSKVTPLFLEVLALHLAADIAYSLVQSVTLRESLETKAANMLRTTRSFDAQEGTPQRVTASSWIRSRR